MPKSRTFADVPIGRELWRALENGRLPKQSFDALLLEHHFSVCATCPTELNAYHSGAPAAPEPTDESAERFLAELLQLPVGERLDRLNQAQPASMKALAHRLLDESFACLPANPMGSLERAKLAQVAAERASPQDREALVLAHAHQGNALRAVGRLRDAGRHMAEARRRLHEVDDRGLRITELSVYATVDWMEGTYQRELSEFEHAEALLNHAVLLFSLKGNLATVYQVMLSLGELYIRQGNTRDALDAISKVLAYIQEADSPRLYWSARFNHAVYLAEAGLFQEARRELLACRAARALEHDEFFLRRARWLEGRIALGLGQDADAERLLAGVREGYLGDGSGINMALVSLDLACLYLETGDSAKLKRVAEEMALIFSANDVHREALAALVLFQEAVRQEGLTAAFLFRLRRYLEAARNNPSLPFERPS